MKLIFFVIIMSILISCNNSTKQDPNLFFISKKEVDTLTYIKELPYKISINNTKYDSIIIYVDSPSIYRPSMQTYYNCNSEFIENYYGSSNKYIKKTIRRNKKAIFHLGITPSIDKGMDNLKLYFLYKINEKFKRDTIYYSIKNGDLIKKSNETYCE